MSITVRRVEYVAYVTEVTKVTQNARHDADHARVNMRQNCRMTEWLTVPDLVERLDSTVSRVRRMIADRQLPAARIDGVLKVPAEFLDGNEPRPELHGTAIVLADHGFTDDEIVDWLLSDEPSIGMSPIAAFKAGKKALVRRVAQALG